MRLNNDYKKAGRYNTHFSFPPAAQWTNNNQLELGAQARAKVESERFVTHNNSIVTAQVGASVILHCKTSSATGGLVSAGKRWILFCFAITVFSLSYGMILGNDCPWKLWVF